jgi:hypothetical protein
MPNTFYFTAENLATVYVVNFSFAHSTYLATCFGICCNVAKFALP